MDFELPPDISLSQHAYNLIKVDIISCDLSPGSEVSEAQLAQKYDLGKAPIRWALSTLTKEGLVTALPRRGYVIAPITLQAVNDIFDLRRILEPAAARKAAGRVDGGKLRELEALVLAGYSPGDRESERNFLRANKEFHVAVAQASGNERLANTLAHVLDEMERLFHLGLALRNRSDEMKHEHESLIEALVAGERDEAERITADQVESARRMVLDAIMESASIQERNITVG